MRGEIEKRFAQNVGRVDGLIELYLSAGPGRGRRDTIATDVLRAAVVFLHAALEDLIRSALEWKLPAAAPEQLNGIPFLGNRDKLTFPELARHRGKSVQDLIDESIAENSTTSNYNHPGEIEKALAKLGIGAVVIDPYRDKLGTMMKRRHWIVHRADRNEMSGSGQHAALSLNPSTVRYWVEAVKDFGKDVFEKL